MTRDLRSKVPDSAVRTSFYRVQEKVEKVPVAGELGLELELHGKEKETGKRL
jgi:hypothetical protein